MSACICHCCRRPPIHQPLACASSSSACATSSVSTTNSVRIRHLATTRQPTTTCHHLDASTASCARRNMAGNTTSGGCAITATSDGAIARSTSTRPWSVSRSVLSRTPSAGSLVMARSCSAPSPTKTTACENPNALAVDLGTTLRVAHRAHSLNNNRPEQNQNCVTYVVGLNCYLCPRLLNPRQIQHAHPGKRAVAGGPWSGLGLADFLDQDQRQFGQRFGVGQRRPFVIWAHQRHGAAAGIGRGLECLGVPLH